MSPIKAGVQTVLPDDATKVALGDGTYGDPPADGGAVTWGAITGTLSEQADLGSALGGKAAASHGHAESDVTNLVTDLAAKAASSHGHAPGDITGTAVVTADARLSDARTPTSHGHGPSEITGTAVITADSRLSDARTPTAHSHTGADINSGSIDGDRLAAPTTTKRGGATATGTPSGKFYRDDDTWAVPAGGGSPLGVLDDMQISVLQSDGTLNAASGVQTWAGTNKTAQDVFTVEANTTYKVRGQFIINTGATTHTTAMAWALNGATVASFEYLAMLWAAAANAIATAQSTVHVSGVASKVLNATGTLVYTIIQFEGILVVTNGGTITPQINFSANPTGTNLMKRGSWVSFSKIGADTFVEAGGWA